MNIYVLNKIVHIEYAPCIYNNHPHAVKVNMFCRLKSYLNCIVWTLYQLYYQTWSFAAAMKSSAKLSIAEFDVLLTVTKQILYYFNIFTLQESCFCQLILHTQLKTFVADGHFFAGKS